jgi:fatty-acid desaturase
MCGATIGYHRLLTHRSFRCSKAVEYTLAVLGICCLQEASTRWVAIHRLHHRHADRQPDPHSPLARLIWGYVGWMFVINRLLERLHLAYDVVHPKTSGDLNEPLPRNVAPDSDAAHQRAMHSP